MPVYKPKGVNLIDPADFKTHRSRIFTKVKEATMAAFPRKFGGVRMELADDLDYDSLDDFSPDEIKSALLSDKTLARKLRGTVRLFDDTTNELLDEQHVTLANVPWLSDRGTFTKNGNNYVSAMQQRLVAGPYGRTMDNGQVETHFNVKPGSGPGYRVLLEPDTAQFRLRVGPQAAIHLYSVLKTMGVPDDELKATWGEGTWKRNADAYNPKAFDQAYTRLVPAKEQMPDATVQQKAEQLRAAFDRSQVLKSVRTSNLFGDAVKRAAVDEALRATSFHDKSGDELAEHFQPDLTPKDLRLEINAIYGKHGPRLASMSKWPDRWINKDEDPLGWLEWYQNYHGGRRCDDDDRQIRRWLAFKNRQLAAFKRNPTPRRGFALRNWAIDGPKHLAADAEGAARKAMDEYRDRAWAEWTAKKAALDAEDVAALTYIFNKHGAHIPVVSDPDVQAEALRRHVWRDLDGSRHMSFKGPASMLKAAVFLQHALARIEDFDVPATTDGRLLIKSAAGTVDMTEHSGLVEDAISWRF